MQRLWKKRNNTENSRWKHDAIFPMDLIFRIFSPPHLTRSSSCKWKWQDRTLISIICLKRMVPIYCFSNLPLYLTSHRVRFPWREKISSNSRTRMFFGILPMKRPYPRDMTNSPAITFFLFFPSEVKKIQRNGGESSKRKNLNASNGHEKNRNSNSICATCVSWGASYAISMLPSVRWISRRRSLRSNLPIETRNSID